MAAAGRSNTVFIAKCQLRIVWNLIQFPIWLTSTRYFRCLVVLNSSEESKDPVGLSNTTRSSSIKRQTSLVRVILSFYSAQPLLIRKLLWRLQGKVHRRSWTSLRHSYKSTSICFVQRWSSLTSLFGFRFAIRISKTDAMAERTR